MKVDLLFLHVLFLVIILQLVTKSILINDLDLVLGIIKYYSYGKRKELN